MNDEDKKFWDQFFADWAKSPFDNRAMENSLDDLAKKLRTDLDTLRGEVDAAVIAKRKDLESKGKQAIKKWPRLSPEERNHAVTDFKSLYKLGGDLVVSGLEIAAAVCEMPPGTFVRKWQEYVKQCKLLGPGKPRPTGFPAPLSRDPNDKVRFLLSSLCRHLGLK